MTDPYAETDDWIVPATRPHSHAQPVSAPEPSGSTPEAGEGGRVARYADALRLHQFNLSEARRGNAACLCGEDLTTGLASAGGVDRRLGLHQASVLGSVADQETAELRAERDSIFGKAIEFKRKYIETKARAEAAEAESARLASVVELHKKALNVALNLVGIHPDLHTKDDREALEGCRMVLDDELAALASVGVSGSADDRREANASQAPDTATPGEVWVDTPDDFEGYAASSADDRAGER